MLRIIVFLVLGAGLVGCGRQDAGRVPVSGSVIYRGEPVSYGSIAFRPAPQSTGPAAGTDIRDGKYAIPTETGPGTGSYLARITIVRKDALNRREFGGKGGGVTSLEVPIELTADKVKFDFELAERKGN